MSGVELAAAVEFLGHDEWCDYADKSPEGCEDGFGCGVWRRAHLLLGSDWLAKRDAALLAAERERIAAVLTEQAVLRFDFAGPHDERGAAFWDAASYVREAIARTSP